MVIKKNFINDHFKDRKLFYNNRIIIIVGEKMTIEFIAAKCPNCGGELRLPNNTEKVFCMYCGYEILIHNSTEIKGNVIVSVDIGKTLGLASIIEDAKNYNDGYKYYSQVIESDPKNATAWLGRARCAAWLPGDREQRLNEAISYCRIAREIGITSNKEAQKTAYSILHSTWVHCEYIIKKLNSDGLSDKAARATFLGTYYPLIKMLLQYCWLIDPSEKSAEGIVYSIGILKEREILKENDFYEIIAPVYAKFPDKVRILFNQRRCFIATAALGDINHPYIEVLRQFRDKILNNYFSGRLFISVYYRTSPPIARIIEKYPILQKITQQIIIVPFYKVALKSLQRYGSK